MRVVRRLFLGLATAMATLALALLSLAIVATIKFYSDRDPALSASPLATGSDAHLRLSRTERQSIATEYPVYFSRGKEQTYLTLAEWYQVYSYNEFGGFLANGGRQTDFPFATAISNFWGCYFLSLEKSRGQEFNWQYNFVSWIIGINLTAEYGVKFAYENTVGRVTQAIAGSNTEADRFIAKSWNSYAKTLYDDVVPLPLLRRSLGHLARNHTLQRIVRQECRAENCVLGLVPAQGVIRAIVAPQCGAKGQSDIQRRPRRQSRASGR